MLKPESSRYNDSRPERRWYKAKKGACADFSQELKKLSGCSTCIQRAIIYVPDYITGYGDTADYAIIGAAWDRDRSRELRGENDSTSLLGTRC